MLYIDPDTIKEFNWSEIANRTVTSSGGTAAPQASFGTPPSSLPLPSFFYVFLRDGEGGGGGGSNVDHLMMVLWSIGVVTYLVLLSPLVFVSMFFWIVAAEFGLHTMLLKSTFFQYPDTDDDLHSTYSESSHPSHEEEIEQEVEDLIQEGTTTTKIDPIKSTTPGKGKSWRTMTPEIIRVRAEEAKDYEFTLGPFS